MEAGKAVHSSIDAYISSFPDDVQNLLNQMRETIKGAAPEAEEKISYQMPTFFLKGNLVHFAAHKKHIGFYPTPSAVQAFEKELSAYQIAKGSVQFPFDKPLPLELIAEMVRFRVSETLKQQQAKSKRERR